MDLEQQKRKLIKEIAATSRRVGITLAQLSALKDLLTKYEKEVEDLEAELLVLVCEQRKIERH